MKKINLFVAFMAALMISGNMMATNMYPGAWVTKCGKAAPEVTGDWNHSYYTFHCFNPGNGDEDLFSKYNEDPSSLNAAEIARIKEVFSLIDPDFNAESFDPTTFDPKTLGGYANWRADYEISFDQAVEASEYKLMGQYDAWSANWVECLSKDLEAGEVTALMAAFDPNLKYKELVMAIPVFNCGIVGLDREKNAGKTITVNLCIYNPNDASDKQIVKTTTYTFPMPGVYPAAWVTECVKDAPVVENEWDKSFYTFHCFDPSGDEDVFAKYKSAPATLDAAEIARIKEVFSQIDANFDADNFDPMTFDPMTLGGYANWRADYEVYFDQDVDAAEYKLMGQYDAWSANWIECPNKTLKSGEIMNLMGGFDPNLKYKELVMAIPVFNCGIVGLDENLNAGKTIHVSLYIYNPNDSTDKKLISTTSYTFPVPPIVVENVVVETEENKDDLEELKAENAGVSAMTDDDTNIYPATEGYESDKEKCVVVVLTDIQITTEGEVYEAQQKVVTYNVTPKYRDEDGVMHVIPNSEIDQPITFRLPVLSQYAGKKVAVYHKANDAAKEDYLGLYEVQELTGSYYVELSASEFSKYIIKSVINFYERETTAGMIGSLCVPFDIVADSLAVSGAEFFEINYRNNTTTTAVTEVEGTAVTALEGGKAYVFHATGTLVHVGWKDGSEAKTAVTTGSMVGNLGDTIYPAELYAAGTVEPYIITSEGIFRPCGPKAYVPMNRAYLNMAVVPTQKVPAVSARRIRLTSTGANIVTEIENVNANVNANRKMMVDGQLVIIRDGKMFNAQGQEL